MPKRQLKSKTNGHDVQIFEVKDENAVKDEILIKHEDAGKTGQECQVKIGENSEKSGPIGQIRRNSDSEEYSDDDEPRTARPAMKRIKRGFRPQRPPEGLGGEPESSDGSSDEGTTQKLGSVFDRAQRAFRTTVREQKVLQPKKFNPCSSSEAESSQETKKSSENGKILQNGGRKKSIVFSSSDDDDEHAINDYQGATVEELNSEDCCDSDEDSEPDEPENYPMFDKPRKTRSNKRINLEYVFVDITGIRITPQPRIFQTHQPRIFL